MSRELRAFGRLTSPRACLFAMLFCVDKSALIFLPSFHLILHPSHIIAHDLLTSACLRTSSLDGVRGTSRDALPLRKRLQRRPSPAVAAAAAGEDPPEEQEAESTPGAGGHTQTEGGEERKTPPPHLHNHKHVHNLGLPLDGLQVALVHLVFSTVD